MPHSSRWSDPCRPSDRLNRQLSRPVPGPPAHLLFRGGDRGGRRPTAEDRKDPPQRHSVAGPPGFEPGLTDPESVGLPLPHGPVGDLRRRYGMAEVTSGRLAGVASALEPAILAYPVPSITALDRSLRVRRLNRHAHRDRAEVPARLLLHGEDGSGATRLLEDRVGGIRRVDHGTAPRPSIHPGFPITEYSQRELVALVRWIESDGPAPNGGRGPNEMMYQLGFARRGARIVSALIAAIRDGRRAQRRSVRQLHRLVLRRRSAVAGYAQHRDRCACGKFAGRGCGDSVTSGRPGIWGSTRGWGPSGWRVNTESWRRRFSALTTTLRARSARAIGAAQSRSAGQSVADALIWEQEVPGSNPDAPTDANVRK